MRLTRPETVCLIIIPISTSISEVPKPPTTPSSPHPKAATSATSIPKSMVELIAPPVIPVLPIRTLAKTQVATPRHIRALSSCLKMILPSIAPIAGQSAVIGIIIEPAVCRATI